jgi:hypothetical protein
MTEEEISFGTLPFCRSSPSAALRMNSGGNPGTYFFLVMLSLRSIFSFDCGEDSSALPQDEKKKRFLAHYKQTRFFV